MGEYISSYLRNIFNDKDLKRREREILIILKSFDKENTNKVQVKISTLMECIDTTNKSGVCKLLKSLKSKGYLDIEKGIGRTASSYMFIKDYMIINEEFYSERILTTNELSSKESLTTDSRGKGNYTSSLNSGDKSYTTDNFRGEEILTTNELGSEESLTTNNRCKGNYTSNLNSGNESYTTDNFRGEEILTTNELSSEESLTTNNRGKENYTSSLNSGDKSYTTNNFRGEEILTANELSGNESYTTSKDINNKYNINKYNNINNNNNYSNNNYSNNSRDINSNPKSPINSVRGNGTSSHNHNYVNNSLEDVFINILKHWNNQNISSILQLDLRARDSITSALRKYSFESIIKAISNYSEVYYSSYFYDIKWNLNSFLTSQKGIDKFHDNGCMWQKYNENLYEENEDVEDEIIDKYSYIDV